MRNFFDFLDLKCFADTMENRVSSSDDFLHNLRIELNNLQELAGF